MYVSDNIVYSYYRDEDILFFYIYKNEVFLFYIKNVTLESSLIDFQKYCKAIEKYMNYTQMYYLFTLGGIINTSTTKLSVSQ